MTTKNASHYRMENLEKLFAQNRKWVGTTTQSDPDFFLKLSEEQRPEYLWIGCSESRVPANRVTGMPPGELFVHRNIANIVAPSDPNSLSVVQYAVEVLQVKHILVCGHYGCDGGQSAWSYRRLFETLSSSSPHRPILHHAEFEAVDIHDPFLIIG